MLEYGVHLVDKVRALLGEPRRIFASFQRVNPRVRGAAVYEGRMTRGTESRFLLYQEGDPVLDEARCPTDDFCESFYLLQRELADSMLRGTPPPQPAGNNLKTLAATFTAYAAASGDFVPVPHQDSARTA